MLYFNPPFHIINGVSLFSDHADPLQYYFMPLMPHLTTIEESETGIAMPQIQLIKYRGDAGNGGFLNFDVNLGIGEEALDEIRQKLRNLANLDEEPRLAPVPLIDGTVKLMLLGHETGDEGDSPTTPAQPQFVLKINQHAKPALFGSNQATFSVQLDEAGVTVIEKALQGEMVPIGVVYSLDYLALRPAYSVRVNADWERVQHHLHESFGVDLLIFSSQVDKVVDELIESRVIEIQVDSFIPPGEDAAELLARLDHAVKEAKDMVLDSFFEPSLDPMREEKDGWDKAIDFAERAALLHASGGLSGVGGFTLKNVDYTRIDQKRLSVDMTERTTVKRSIYPQAHLQGLASVLRDSNGTVDLSRFVIPVDLDDEWFEQRRVQVIARTDFESDQVESINVRLVYDDKPQSVLLDRTQPRQIVQWNSLLVDNQMQRDVIASYEVNFRHQSGVERPATLHSVEEVIDVEHFEVRPHELYNKVPVMIVALDFPWVRYPHVEVQLRYEGNENSSIVQQTFVLEQTKAEVVWNLYLADTQARTFAYKLIYRAVDNRDVEMPWVSTDAEQITIRDPFPNKRRLQIVPALNWQTVNWAFVDSTYLDLENGIQQENSFYFNRDNQAMQTLEIPLANPQRRNVNFRTTLIHSDGRVTESPPSVTVANRIIVTNQMRGHRIIEVLPEAIPFAKLRLSMVDVLLRYEDTQAGLSYIDSMSFRSHEEAPRYFEFDYADSRRADYEVQVTYTYLNGLQLSSDWESSDLDTLIVRLR